ncbi:hypothetical protein D0Z06_18910 [Geodermatophilus marinus]|nr:hypothetical protein D0Z06_18910 [Geodermatophilus sp. LHW52908]
MSTPVSRPARERGSVPRDGARPWDGPAPRTATGPAPGRGAEPVGTGLSGGAAPPATRCRARPRPPRPSPARRG